MIFCLLFSVFFIIYFTIHPIKYKKIPINMATSSIIILVFLIFFWIIKYNDLLNWLIWNEQLNPRKILLIFFSIAYISISTDKTGIFDILSVKIINFSKWNTKKLFIFFFLFASIITIFTSNDITILTLTPIIFYLWKHSKINILPFLFIEFFTANTLSMALITWNPANIIIADTLNIWFFQYFKTMIFPILVASLSNYIILYNIFKKDLKSNFSFKINYKPNIESYKNMVTHIIFMLFMILTLLLSDFIWIHIYQIVLFYLWIFILIDLLYYLLNEKNINFKNSHFIVSFKKLPWSIWPFIYTLFVIIWVFVNTNIFVNFVYFLNNNIHTILWWILKVWFLSLFIANIISNQAMSILFSHILINPNFIINKEILKWIIYSIVISANLAANLTIIWSLAGFMWKKILSSKWINITYFQFLKIWLSTTILTAFVTYLALYIIL